MIVLIYLLHINVKQSHYKLLRSCIYKFCARHHMTRVILPCIYLGILLDNPKSYRTIKMHVPLTRNKNIHQLLVNCLHLICTICHTKQVQVNGRHSLSMNLSLLTTVIFHRHVTKQMLKHHFLPLPILPLPVPTMSAIGSPAKKDI